MTQIARIQILVAGGRWGKIPYLMGLGIFSFGVDEGFSEFNAKMLPYPPVPLFVGDSRGDAPQVGRGRKSRFGSLPKGMPTAS